MRCSVCDSTTEYDTQKALGIEDKITGFVTLENKEVRCSRCHESIESVLSEFHQDDELLDKGV